MKRRPLTREEIPTHLLEWFVLDNLPSQIDGKRLTVLRICRDCLNTDRVTARQVRTSLKRGCLTALCKTCALKLTGSRNKGEDNGNWKGGRHVTPYGYVKAYAPNHPYKIGNGSGYVMEHRLVMEESLGRYLEAHETVHHKNGNRGDNRIENLELWTGKHGKGVRDSDNPHCPTCTCHNLPI